MADIAAFKNLTIANISKDLAKTKDRVSELWSGSTAAQKAALKVNADSNQIQTVYNTQKTGRITARMAYAIAKTFDVSPYYLTAQSDERGLYSDEDGAAFLAQYNSKKPAAKPAKATKASADKPAKKAGKAKSVAAAPKAPKSTKAPKAPKLPKTTIAPDSSPVPTTLSFELDSEELLLLFNSLILRADLGFANAQEKLDKIVELLLS